MYGRFIPGPTMTIVRAPGAAWKAFYMLDIITDTVITMCENCGCGGQRMRRGGGCGCGGSGTPMRAPRSFLRHTAPEDLKDYAEDLRAETQRVEQILKERASETD